MRPLRRRWSSAMPSACDELLPNAQAAKSGNSNHNRSLLKSHSFFNVIGRFSLPLIWPASQTVGRAANAVATSIQNVRVGLF
jgi:hypothetical protein